MGGGGGTRFFTVLTHSRWLAHGRSAALHSAVSPTPHTPSGQHPQPSGTRPSRQASRSRGHCAAAHPLSGHTGSLRLTTAVTVAGTATAAQQQQQNTKKTVRGDMREKRPSASNDVRKRRCRRAAYPPDVTRDCVSGRRRAVPADCRLRAPLHSLSLSPRSQSLPIPTARTSKTVRDERTSHPCGIMGERVCYTPYARTRTSREPHAYISNALLRFSARGTSPGVNYCRTANTSGPPARSSLVVIVAFVGIYVYVAYTLDVTYFVWDAYII